MRVCMGIERVHSHQQIEIWKQSKSVSSLALCILMLLWSPWPPVYVSLFLCFRLRANRSRLHAGNGDLGRLKASFSACFPLYVSYTCIKRLYQAETRSFPFKRTSFLFKSCIIHKSVDSRSM